MEKKIVIQFKSFYKKTLALYLHSVRVSLQKQNVMHSLINLPTETYRLTVNKSPHVNITAREQFETRLYKTALISGKIPTSVWAGLTKNKPQSVRLKIYSEN